MDILNYLLIGSAAGLLAGFLGIGGAVLVIPVMLYILNDLVPSDNLYNIVSTISLSSAFISGVFSSRKHFKNKNLYFDTLKPLAFGSILGTAPGTALAMVIPSSYLKILFSFILVFVSLKMLFDNSHKDEFRKDPIHSKNILFFAGFFIAVFSSLTGLGGGVVFVPILTIYFRFDAKKAAGTSSFVMMFNTLPSVLFRMFIPVIEIDNFFNIGYFIPAIVLPMIIGSAVFSTFGAQINYKTNSHLFKRISGGIFLILAIRMIVMSFMK
ncbi:MAG: sulfite exporter TauE/SafE family protein [Candidatus Delongbacteria bacterium]|nr:sulfite exporter TauE/SafE family protein [Candidatus Delongbacteria bacterium]MBN2834034.1 sulfite exporter TauE/SafE family protein [Candidatus Delongbacteria bacterium]